MTLWYLPLEPYPERYTMQLSAPKVGWLEKNWIEAGVEYRRIDGAETIDNQIKTGVAVDAIGRTVWCFEQVQTMLNLAWRGEIKNSDVIYLDDFFTPGFEAIPYAFNQLGIRPKIYANLWAQSVDEFDFTYPMRNWMRPYERMMGEVLDGIFVAVPALKDLVVFGGIAPANKVHAIGHPFDPDEVKSRMPPGDLYKRKYQVVFSSRWDKEKNPQFFLEVARKVKETMPAAKFVVCSSAPKIRSNDHQLLVLLGRAEREGLVEVREGLTKEEYYSILAESRIQFNCSDQDWVSYVLLEASVAGCYLVYPYFRSFPDALNQNTAFMYRHKDVSDAADRVSRVVSGVDDLWTPEEIQRRSWIHERHRYTWLRMLRVMGVTHTLDVGMAEWTKMTEPAYKET